MQKKFYVGSTTGLYTGCDTEKEAVALARQQVEAVGGERSIYKRVAVVKRQVPPVKVERVK